jgi:hypothetical protein
LAAKKQKKKQQAIVEAKIKAQSERHPSQLSADMMVDSYSVCFVYLLMYKTSKWARLTVLPESASVILVIRSLGSDCRVTIPSCGGKHDLQAN